jgi:hypothetical protein
MSSSNIVNPTPYLRTSREFPEEPKILIRELDKMYLDVANNVNTRIIGLFPKNTPAITGEKWFLTNNIPQQTLRKVFTFTATTSINHNISVTSPSQFIRCFGSYTNGTNTFGLPFATSVAVAGLITFYVTSTQIVFLVGAGAPALTSGTIVLEWLSSS